MKSGWWPGDLEHPEFQGMTTEDLVAQVKERDRAVWQVFCENTLGKHDPAVYPRRCLIAFLANKGTPLLEDLVGNLEDLDHHELVLCCKAAVKQGAPPLEGRWKDPARYSEDELREYLHSKCGGSWATDSKRGKPAFPPEPPLPFVKDGFAVLREPALEDEGRPPAAADPSRAQLIAATKAADLRAWQAFCSATLGRHDPAAYPTHYLAAFVEGTGPPPPGGPLGVDLAGFCAEELVLLCKAAVKEGSPPLEGDRGRDPSRYTREELLEYLQSIRFEAEAQAEAMAEEPALEDGPEGGAAEEAEEEPAEADEAADPEAAEEAEAAEGEPWEDQQQPEEEEEEEHADEMEQQ